MKSNEGIENEAWRRDPVPVYAVELDTQRGASPKVASRESET